MSHVRTLYHTASIHHSSNVEFRDQHGCVPSLLRFATKEHFRWDKIQLGANAIKLARYRTKSIVTYLLERKYPFDMLTTYYYHPCEVEYLNWVVDD